MQEENKPFKHHVDCDHQEVRCCCGGLLARLIDLGVELKCRRCKRTMVLKVEGRVEIPTHMPAPDKRERS